MCCFPVPIADSLLCFLNIEQTSNSSFAANTWFSVKCFPLFMNSLNVCFDGKI